LERRDSLTPPESLTSHGPAVQDYAWLCFTALMLFVFLLPFSSYVASLPLLQEEWGLTNTQAGAIFSAYLLGYAVSALLLIPLTDRFSSRNLLLAAGLVSVASHIAFPLLAQGVISAVALRLVAGIGLVGIYNIGMRVVAERFALRGRGLAVGGFVTAFYAGSSVSLAMTGALMAYLDWREAYIWMAVVSAVGMPLVVILLRSHGGKANSASSGRLDISVLRSPLIRLYILGYSLHAAELYVVRVWLPVFLAAALVTSGVEPQIAAVRAATVGGLALALGSVGPLIGGALSDRFGRPMSAAAIFALSSACSAAIGWMGGFPWPVLVGLTVVYGWAIAADSAIYSTAVTESAEPGKLGSTMAIHSFIGFMGGVIGPVVVGGVLDVAPQAVRWGVGFSFVALLGLAAIAGLMRVRRYSGRGAVSG
jgi:MFS family permease